MVVLEGKEVFFFLSRASNFVRKRSRESREMTLKVLCLTKTLSLYSSPTRQVVGDEKIRPMTSKFQLCSEHRHTRHVNSDPKNVKESTAMAVEFQQLINAEAAR